MDEVQLGSDQRAALALLAHALLEHQQPGGAVTLLEAMLRIDPGARQPLKSLALAYLEAGRAADALDAATRFIGDGQLPRDDAPIYLIQGRALRALGRDAESRQAMEKFLEGRSAA